MAEKTCSQESLPLSQESYMMLINDLGEGFANFTTDIREKTVEEILAEEKAKCKYLTEQNQEMKAINLSLDEKLRNEVKAKQELEQVKELLELKLKEQLIEKEIIVQEFAKKDDELNRARQICYEETAAKEKVLQKLKEIENRLNIHGLNFERAQEQKFYEEEDLNAFGDFSSLEQIGDLFSQFPVDCSKTASSLPATESWPGDYDFKVFFINQEKAQWVYSSPNNKLYVKKDAPCQINFSTNSLMPEGFCIRIMPLYSSVEHILENVHRCVNHSMAEIQNKIPEAEHLVRVESRNVFYDSETVTGRHSAVVPFENPPVGQNFSSYIFKFACFQSCAGGPNRRPLMLCFTLENREMVVGRQKVHLKICACPLRDSKTDEKLSENQTTKKKAVKRERVESSDAPPQKKISIPDYDKPVVLRPGPFILQIEDRKQYDFLKFLKSFLGTSKMPLDRASLINLIQSTYTSSSEDESKK